jgi:GTPase SAR1 family protein
MPEHDQTNNWQRADEKILQSLPLGVALFKTLRGQMSRVSRITWSPDGLILAASSGRRVHRWEVNSWKSLPPIEGDSRQVNCVAFDPTGSILASGGNDHSIRLWEAASGRFIRSLVGHNQGISSVAWSPNGVHFASASTEGTIRIWDTKTWISQEIGHWKSLKREKDGKGVILGVAWSWDSKRIAGASYDLPVWDAKTGNQIAVMRSAHGLYDVAWSPQAKTHLLAAATSENNVQIWEANTFTKIRDLEGHTKHVRAVAFSSDGALLASSSDDNTTRLWRCSDWQEVAVIRNRRDSLMADGLVFHPTLPLLARVGSGPGGAKMTTDRILHILELDLAYLLGQPHKTAPTYISAKVVLVGESRVGKSYLAHRIATGVPPEDGTIKSTHGMKFWPLEPERLSPLAKAPEGESRDVVLWDMGGQDEYRLIHQLFLHDTTLALVLFDPTRGTPAFKEVETWNKALENQLRGRAAVKLLVGSKLDEPSTTIDHQAVQRLIKDCGFAKYYETSALTGRGVAELCEAAAKAIDWDDLGKTTRPELFQAIRDEIARRREKGVVVVLFDDLNEELQTNEESETFSLMAHVVAMSSDAEAGTEALDAVCCQLASQGVIARAKTSSGKSALILRVEEVERYAGSLIIAAKKNPRGVPALELRAIAQENYSLPGISDQERLPREQEKPVLECTVQLMLEHGICFQHEGLLIFPSLFAPAPEGADGKLLHSVSLYYDFAGAIDNIYASMVAWLVLAKEFGKVRLWSDRAEFEVKDGGLCGLRKVGRPGGFAHVDVYFEQETGERQRTEFISFVEDHLARNGVEIREHVAIKCSCNHEFSDDTLRQRIARGDKDVVCPVCETRHNLSEGASASREHDATISQHTWALRTRIEELREKLTESVVQVLGKAEAAKPATGPIRLLHLSDLHFTAATPVAARLQWLIDDIKQDSGLGFKELDYLVISGDFTDKGNLDGFEKAYEFVSGLTEEFGLSAERCIFVPGNHDVSDIEEAYDWKKKTDGLKDGEWVKQGDIYLARNAAKYPLRLKAFSDAFFHKFVQRPYPLDCATQGTAVPFWETGIQFLTLNSCWQVDEFYRKRSGVNVEAVANAIREAQKQETSAREAGQLPEGKPLLRIAVWHHAVAGPEQMTDTAFLTNLQKAGVRVGMHGDIHELRRDVVGHWHEQGKQLHILGAGSFGAPPEGRPESMPRLYNVIEIDRNLTSMKVHTRQQPKVDGAWTGWHDWPNPKDNSSKVAYYDIDF